MPVWGWILIGAIVVIALVAVAVVGRSVGGRKRTERLQSRFGPEYERTVGTVGDQRAAEKELAAREHKRAKLDIVALSPEARNNYADSWRKVQTAFVDDPTGAVGEADSLVSRVMRDRGYPVDDFEQRAADISVDHPQVVENYRTAHRIHRSQEAGTVSTEEQREAFVHYRALFEELLATNQNSNSSKEARA